MFELNSDQLYYFTIVFSWIIYFWDQFVNYREYKVCVDNTQRTSDVVAIMDEDDFTKSRNYKIDRSRFAFIRGLYSQIELSLILHFNVLPYFWNLSSDIVYSIGYESEILRTCVFLTTTSVVSSIISLPWDLYSTFVIEEKHGFNKQTIGFYFKDLIKKMIVSQIIMWPLFSAVIAIVQFGGDYFFIYAWIFLSFAILFMLTIYPTFIAPLFDTYEKLKDGDLKERIEALASKLDYPLTNIYVVDGSARSSHSNAYLYGFWKNKRIVLFDTLIANYEMDIKAKRKAENPDYVEKKDANEAVKGCLPSEIEAVLGHELGHWALWHIMSTLVAMQLNLLFMLWGFAYFYKQPALYAAFGFTNEHPTVIGLMIVFQYIMAPYNEVVSFLVTIWTRSKEFAADAFAAKLGYAKELITGLIKLQKDNLSYPIHDALYSWLHHDHPPILERIHAIREVKVD